MKLTKQIIIKKDNPIWKECDKICYLSKNLYNQALYRIRKKYDEEGVFLNYNILTKELSKENQADFRAMRANVSQQTLMLIDQSYRNYFSALKIYNKNPENFNSKINPPKFKDKNKGRFIAIYTLTGISRIALKKGFIKLSGLNFKIESDIKDIKQVRIIPKSLGNYCIDIIYEKEELSKLDNNNYASIDIGVNNLATVVTNTGTTPFIINGKPLKSINQFYNKRKAKLQSQLKKEQKTSKRIQRLTLKRNNKIKDYMHKASKEVVNILKQTNISKIVIGKNKEWKQSVNIGKRNNQNFVSIPHANFINMITYKAKLLGIEVLTREESYTSKCSFLDNEDICKHKIYKGKRIKRGLFQSSNGTRWNADVNGSCNILKKEFPNAFANGIEGILVFPKIIKTLNTYKKVKPCHV